MIAKSSGANQGRTAKPKATVHGKKPFLTTGRLASRHEATSKSSGVLSRARSSSKGSVRTTRVGCGVRQTQKPTRSLDVVDEEFDDDGDEIDHRVGETLTKCIPRQAPAKKCDQKTRKKKTIVESSDCG